MKMSKQQHKTRALKSNSQQAGRRFWPQLTSSPKFQYLKFQASSDQKFKLILILITVLIYVNSLKCGFVYDDRRAILENRDVVPSVDSSSVLEGARSFLFLWTNDYWGNPMHSAGSHKSYRPLVILSYKIQSILLPFDALWFHLINVILHTLVVLRVFQLTSSVKISRLFFGAPSEEESNLRLQQVCSYVSSLLFACHPIHVEAVTSIVGRAELMGSLFALLSFESLVECLSVHEAKSRRGRELLFKSVTFEMLACLSKENCGLAVILINVLTTIMLAKRPNLTRQFVIHSSALLAFVGIRFLIPLMSLLVDSDSSHLDWSQFRELQYLPRFSAFDNPLAQDERQFCLRNLNAFKFSQNEEEEFSAEICSDPERLKILGNKIRATRLYLPVASLMLLFNPSELSYDWTLDSLGGLIDGLNEPRYYLTMLTWVVLTLFFLIWFNEKRQFITNQVAHLVDRPLSPSLSVADSQSDNSDCEQSDASSVRSNDTTRTRDSGFVDSSYSQRKSRRSSNDTNEDSSDENETSRASQLDPFAWSLFWLLIPLLPSSNLIWPAGFLIAERILYLPSVGFCLLAANLLTKSFTSLTGARIDAWPPQRIANLIPLRGLAIKMRPRGGLEPALWLALLLALPAILWGCSRTIKRNDDWRDEVSLFNSNLRQSRAKSLANLATVLSDESQTSRPMTSDRHIESLYREALELEPHSAELHYNLALVLHDRSRRLIGERLTLSERPGAKLEEASSTHLTTIERHYRLALEFKPNFPLAGLNLGAFQWEMVGEFEEPMRVFLDCGLGMAPESTRNFHQHVQTQIECLISGAKLCLDQRKSEQTRLTSCVKSKTSGSTTATTTSTDEMSADNSACLYQKFQASRGSKKALELQHCDQFAWADWTREKSKQIDNFPSLVTMDQFGDLYKQLASIHWIQFQLESHGSNDEKRESKFLTHAVEFALKSRISVDSKVYVTFIDSILNSNETYAMEMLQRIVNVEDEKASRGRIKEKTDLAALHQYRARLLMKLDRIKFAADSESETRKALELAPSDFDVISEAAYQAYELKQFERSAKLYARALELLVSQTTSHEIESSQTKRLRLAKAYTNLGAIQQVRGRLEDAKSLYRKAIEFRSDQDDSIAKENLRRLEATRSNG